MSAPAPVTAYTLTLQARRFNHRIYGDYNGRYECSVCGWAVRPNLSLLYDVLPWVTTPCIVVQAATIAHAAFERP